MTAGASSLRVTPAPVLFGYVSPGATRSLPVTVRNLGGTRVRGEGTVDGRGFSIEGNAAYAIGPYRWVTLTVRFTSGGGPAWGTLSLTGGGGATVALRANGAGAASVSPSPSLLTAGGTVEAVVANGPGNPRDWVALATPESPLSTFVARKYLDGSATPPATGLRAARVPFTVPATGRYLLRFFANDSLNLLASSRQFSAFPAGYYVAPDGDDAGPGSLERPWRTIQKAADTLVAGETVYIRRGVYAERVVPAHSGTAGQEITFTSPPGEMAVVDGREVVLPDDLAGLLEVQGRSYIRVSGLRVINAGPHVHNAGILVQNSDHVTIERCATSATESSGIGVWDSQDVLVDGNTIDSAGGGGYQECISVSGTVGFEVRNNTVTNCLKEGICLKDGVVDGQVHGNTVIGARAVGIYVDGETHPTHDILVYRNLAYGSQSAGFAVATERGGTVWNVRLENNIAHHNATYGIEVSRCCIDLHPMEKIEIASNTVYENGTTWGGGILDDNSQATGVVIRNNLASQNLTFQVGLAGDLDPAAVAVDHNLIDGFRDYQTDVHEVLGDDYVEGDPLFVNPAAPDLHLGAGSPAVDAGSAVGAPTVDFDGTPRPAGAGFDIGAYERP